MGVVWESGLTNIAFAGIFSTDFVGWHFSTKVLVRKSRGFSSRRFVYWKGVVFLKSLASWILRIKNTEQLSRHRENSKQSNGTQPMLLGGCELNFKNIKDPSSASFPFIKSPWFFFTHLFSLQSFSEKKNPLGKTQLQGAFFWPPLAEVSICRISPQFCTPGTTTIHLGPCTFGLVDASTESRMPRCLDVGDGEDDLRCLVNWNVKSMVVSGSPKRW